MGGYTSVAYFTMEINRILANTPLNFNVVFDQAIVNSYSKLETRPQKTHSYLTLSGGLNKMVDISHTTFSNAFSCDEMTVFGSNFQEVYP